MGDKGCHLQGNGKILEDTACQHSHSNRVQLQDCGPKALSGPLAPIRVSGLLPMASYQTAQDAFKPVAHGLYIEVVHISSSITIHGHLGSEGFAPCIEWVHDLARILLWLVGHSGQALRD